MDYCFNPHCSNYVPEGRMFCTECEKEFRSYLYETAKAKKIQKRRKAKSMLKRIYFWLFVKNKGCHHSCVRCEYFDLCMADLEAANRK